MDPVLAELLKKFLASTPAAAVPVNSALQMTGSERIMSAYKAATEPLTGLLAGSDSAYGLHLVKRRSESSAGKQIIEASKTALDAAIKSIEDELNDAD